MAEHQRPSRRGEQRMASVGERIRGRRVELGWTQDQLGQKAGLSKSFLSDLENGKRSVGANNLLDIARALGVSLDFLMTGTASQDQRREVPIPASLARFAAEEGLTFRHTLVLLEMQQQIVAHRSVKKKEGLDGVDTGSSEAVKEFLEDE
jgi:transcriptional regulator with XRE-family HTH domain